MSLHMIYFLFLVAPLLLSFPFLFSLMTRESQQSCVQKHRPLTSGRTTEDDVPPFPRTLLPVSLHRGLGPSESEPLLPATIKYH